jgi:hypothetical protein
VLPALPQLGEKNIPRVGDVVKEGILYDSSGFENLVNCSNIQGGLLIRIGFFGIVEHKNFRGWSYK